MVIALFAVSLVIAFFSVPVLITRLERARISGEDIHKAGQPLVSEMGGLTIVMGFGAGVLLAVAMVSFFHVFPATNLVVLLAALSTVLLTGLVGLVDDLLGMKQWVKALVPVFAALPLVAVRAGHTWIRIPFVGTLNFWIFCPLGMILVGVTVTTNAMNMRADFNGPEVRMGLRPCVPCGYCCRFGERNAVAEFADKVTVAHTLALYRGCFWDRRPRAGARKMLA